MLRYRKTVSSLEISGSCKWENTLIFPMWFARAEFYNFVTRITSAIELIFEDNFMHHNLLAQPLCMIFCYLQRMILNTIAFSHLALHIIDMHRLDYLNKYVESTRVANPSFQNSLLYVCGRDDDARMSFSKIDDNNLWSLCHPFVHFHSRWYYLRQLHRTPFPVLSNGTHMGLLLII